MTQPPGSSPLLNLIGVPDSDVPIYRIFSWRYLRQALIEHKMALVSPSSWDDPYENLIAMSGITYTNETPYRQEFFDKARRQVFGQCWTITPESDAMWRIYSTVSKDARTNRSTDPSVEGVRVRTTPRKQGRIAEQSKERYGYDPHLPPVLRSDDSGRADQFADILDAARTGALSAEQVARLQEGLRKQAPWLEWTGKRETKWFDVDPVALNIHERVSAKAIVAVARRQDVQRDMFADPQQEYREAVRFYEHDVDWSNRLILGDSLTVVASLAKREDQAGKVQMIYVDPPYGIRFRSNFQSQVGQRDVTKRAL